MDASTPIPLTLPVDTGTPTPLSLLVDARTLISDPEKWTRGTPARDKHGDPATPDSKDAVAWCADGAVTRSMYRTSETLHVPAETQHAGERAARLLDTAVSALTLGRYTQMPIYNDATDHGTILHTFDIAISLARHELA